LYSLEKKSFLEKDFDHLIIIFLLAITLCLGTLFSSHPAHAQTFNPENVIKATDVYHGYGKCQFYGRCYGRAHWYGGPVAGASTQM
jgi:hypothetical protein